MIIDALKKLIDGLSIADEEAAACLEEIMEARATQAQVAAFLVALRMRGETPGMIASMARVMRRFAIPIHVDVSGRLIDTCGTGGDEVKTVNASTISGLVVAACGGKVAKHGNRSFTGYMGSADLLEELGVRIDCQPEVVRRCVEKLGFGFIYAPLYHPSMRNVAQVRRELGVRTIFNILGPLSNPAPLTGQLLGVFSESYVDLMAEAMRRLGVEDAVICHGLGGLDEVSIFSRTVMAMITSGEIARKMVEPEDFGLERVEMREVVVKSREEALRRAVEVIAGASRRRDPSMMLVLANASVALMVAGLSDDLKYGVEEAWNAIESGKVLCLLRELIRETGGDITRLEVLINGILGESL